MALYTILCLFTADCPSKDEAITSMLQQVKEIQGHVPLHGKGYLLAQLK